jgi:Protein of unknown function (DUF3307)
MPNLALLVLVAVAVLMLKHAVADFYLQSSFQYLHKGIYGHPGGLMHSTIHVALTPLVYLVLAPASLLLVAGIAVSKFLIHYHVDWLKERLTHQNNWTPQCRVFRFALGTDQLVHDLTYLVIVGLLVAFAT